MCCSAWGHKEAEQLNWTFTLNKRLFSSSSLSAIRVVLSAYLRWLLLVRQSWFQLVIRPAWHLFLANGKAELLTYVLAQHVKYIFCCCWRNWKARFSLEKVIRRIHFCVVPHYTVYICHLVKILFLINLKNCTIHEYFSFRFLYVVLNFI